MLVTKFENMTNPKIIGKIDLSRFENPVKPKYIEIKEEIPVFEYYYENSEWKRKFSHYKYEVERIKIR